MSTNKYEFPYGEVPRVIPKSKADSLASLPVPPASKVAADPWEHQEGGDHYCTLAIQPFEYSMANGLDPMQHTVIKYVTRFRNKGGIKDLEKAKHTLDLLIAHEQAKGT